MIRPASLLNRRSALRLLAAVATALSGAFAHAADDFSVAERALFMTRHLENLRPPTTLRYHYVKAGSMEAGFEDNVQLNITARADKTCCVANADFLSGARRLALPEVDPAEANPVLLYFLERDIREMRRLTTGQEAYFRKRIRMAIYQAAQVSDTTIGYGGRTVAARRFEVLPYVDDPLRARFEKLAGKRYVFIMSDAVPGGVAAISARVDGDGRGTSALWTEQLTLDGVTVDGTP